MPIHLRVALLWTLCTLLCAGEARADCKVYSGWSTSGKPVASIKGSKVYRGWSTSGKPLGGSSGEKIYRGWSTSGKPALSTKGCTPMEVTFAAGALL